MMEMYSDYRSSTSLSDTARLLPFPNMFVTFMRLVLLIEYAICSREYEVYDLRRVFDRIVVTLLGSVDGAKGIHTKIGCSTSRRATRSRDTR